MADRIVEEVHAARRRTCQECDFDLDKLGAYYIRLQGEDPTDVITEVPGTQSASDAYRSPGENGRDAH